MLYKLLGYFFNSFLYVRAEQYYFNIEKTGKIEVGFLGSIYSNILYKLCRKFYI